MAVRGSRDSEIEEGGRIGRLFLLSDADGGRHAIAATAVAMISDASNGDTLLLLAEGRALRLPSPLGTVLDCPSYWPP
jgi:hypothetical protein